MWFKTKLFLSVIGLTFALTQVSLAQGEEKSKKEKSDKKFDLGQVVVTATKTERVAEEVPCRIEVITKQDIEKMPAQKVDDIIRSLSGVSVVRSNGIYTLTTEVTLRGLSNEQARTLVLVDGIPINKTDTGGVNWNRININILKG